MENKEDEIQFRNTQLKLLDIFDKICTTHKLVYWIDFGTLLGAVRHKGFIPWDDDVDVSMPMEDYKKFLKIAERELPTNVFLQTPKTDPGYKQGFAKLRDCYSTYLEHHEVDDGGYHKGIYLDIFPMYVYPKAPKIVKDVLCYITMHTRYNAVVLSKNRYINYPIYALCKIVWLALSPFKDDKIAQIPEDNGYRYYIPKKLIFPLQKIIFENREYFAPQNPHEHLSHIFKDHMTPPPIDKRIGHAKLILPNTPCRHPRALKKNT